MDERIRRPFPVRDYDRYKLAAGENMICESIGDLFL